MRVGSPGSARLCQLPWGSDPLATRPLAGCPEGCVEPLPTPLEPKPLLLAEEAKACGSAGVWTAAWGILLASWAEVACGSRMREAGWILPSR